MGQDADPAWADIVGGLTAGSDGSSEELLGAVRRLRAAGGVAFEVVAGTPVESYGARITFRPARGSNERERTQLAAVAGLDPHPWGTPDWIGIRSGGGLIRCKGYHRRPPALGFTRVHRGLIPGVRPVMASLDGDATEIYAIWPGEISWDVFVERALAGFGSELWMHLRTSRFPPYPRPRRDGFAMSARHVGDRLTTITLYALAPSLPADERIFAEWPAAMTEPEQSAYALAVNAAGRWGHVDGPLHRALAWTFDRSGLVSRAASLRIADVDFDASVTRKPLVE